MTRFGFHEDQQSLYDNGYVYANNGGLFGLAEYFNFATFTTAQREATREAIAYWDDIISVTFVETDSYHADLNYANLASAPATQAYSRIPTLGLSTTLGGQVAGIAGDVWVSASQASNFQFDEGLYGLNTLVHETGHSLGLSHPGGYNFGPGFAVTYTNGAEYAQDARNYTIMSYWNPRDMGSTPTGVPTRDFDWSLMSIAYGSTPMIHDILAAQAMYGADMTTRSGDTVYGFNSTADRDAFDFAKTPWPTMTIWDGGGNDTLDASGYNVDQVIDLTPGSLSSIGGITYAEALEKLSFEQVNANRLAVGYTAVSKATYDANMAAFAAQPDYRGRLTDNVGIAYGATIENAVGGGGNDTIIGNSVGNVLTGNGGNDTLIGNGGSDRLDGGAGNDYLLGGDARDFMTGGSGNDTFVFGPIDKDSQVSAKAGKISVDVITDFKSGVDKIDVSAIDANHSAFGNQDFHWIGSSANKGAADLSYKMYDSINGAENALGIDLDGIDGKGAAGPVTVVFGNVDGGSPDFAIVLLGTNTLQSTDFIF